MIEKGGFYISHNFSKGNWSGSCLAGTSILLIESLLAKLPTYTGPEFVIEGVHGKFTNANNIETDSRSYYCLNCPTFGFLLKEEILFTQVLHNIGVLCLNPHWHMPKPLALNHPLVRLFYTERENGVWAERAPGSLAFNYIRAAFSIYGQCTRLEYNHSKIENLQHHLADCLLQRHRLWRQDHPVFPVLLFNEKTQQIEAVTEIKGSLYDLMK